MMRLGLLFITGLLISAPLAAVELAEYHDEVYLRDHETVRYRIDIDYGIGTEADVDIYVRGFISPPRVRVLESDKDEVKDVRDTDGDWTLDFDFTAKDFSSKYYVEVDSANPGLDGDFEVIIVVNGDSTGDASVGFDRYFFDFESGDESDHYNCSTSTGSGGWPLAMFAGAAIAAVYLRRRVTA